MGRIFELLRRSKGIPGWINGVRVVMDSYPTVYIEHYMMDTWSSVDIEDPNPLTLASALNYREKVLV